MTFLLTTSSDDNRPVFLSGSFNNWQAADPRYRMMCDATGVYSFRFPDNVPLTFPLEYKYTKGDWNQVERDRYGNPTPNRILTKALEMVKDYVPTWEHYGRYYEKRFLPEIKVISEQFEVPQLIKTRRIAVLLPYNYANSERRYPVLYLQDGQNLFDDYAPFGSWEANKRLAVMQQLGYGDIILVAIDHAAENRIKEYSPPQNVKRGRASDGKKYVTFLSNTLKPYIDQHFRTLPTREHTGIGGSSMGGLISIYAGLMFPQVYSKLLIFSPSLWIAPNIHFNAINFRKGLDTRIYIYAGGNESKNMIPNVRRFEAAMKAQGREAKIDFEVSIDPHGTHSERHWGKEFPRAVEWLFFKE